MNTRSRFWKNIVASHFI